MGHESRSLLWTYTVEKLKQRSTYIVAAAVGTFINAYGHLLVPYLRGEADPVAMFVQEYVHHPAVVGLSLALGYCFPLVVGVLSSVLTRYGNRHFELRSWFPDEKPDPVFRCTQQGHITDAGSNTVAILQRHDIHVAQDILGTTTWQQLLDADRAGGKLDPDTIIHCARLRTSYLISHSRAPNGEINVYLSRAPRGLLPPVVA